ncbi:MAG: hypothetical protein CTY12_01045 [Methylotenera sp.]|nr:MAG: hypothetical protein CTY12_01045 [Methylotenera sp.]
MTNPHENIREAELTPSQFEAAQAHQSEINVAYKPKKNWLGMMLILAVPLLFGGALYYGYSQLQAHQAADKDAQPSQKVVIENKLRPLGAEGETLNIAPVGDLATIPTATPMPIADTSSATPIPVLNNSPSTAKMAVQRTASVSRFSRYDAPIMIVQNTSPMANTFAGDTNAANNTEVEAVQSVTGISHPSATETHANDMHLASTPKATAHLLGNRNFVLARGNILDCVLNTAIDSSNSGLVTCTITTHVYSDNGKVVLIERGSLLTGEYSGLKVGEARLAVLWDRIKTPTGAIVDVNSLGSDALGRGGFDGEINKHWTERLGAAILLSSFKDLVAYETAKNGHGSTITFPNSQRAGEDMANQILKQSIHIPPTLTKNQGERVAIVVARDLDFSEVYALKISDKDH